MAQNIIVKSIEKGDTFVLDGETYTTDELAQLSKKELQRLGNALVAEIKSYTGDGTEFSDATDAPKKLVRKKNVVKEFFDSKVEAEESAEKIRKAKKENEILEKADEARRLNELQGLSAADNEKKRKKNLEIIAEASDDDEE